MTAGVYDEKGGDNDDPQPCSLEPRSLSPAGRGRGERGEPTRAPKRSSRAAVGRWGPAAARPAETQERPRSGPPAGIKSRGGEKRRPACGPPKPRRRRRHRLIPRGGATREGTPRARGAGGGARGGPGPDDKRQGSGRNGAAGATNGSARAEAPPARATERPPPRATTSEAHKPARGGGGTGGTAPPTEAQGRPTRRPTGGGAAGANADFGISARPSATARRGQGPKYLFMPRDVSATARARGSGPQRGGPKRSEGPPRLRGAPCDPEAANSGGGAQGERRDQSAAAPGRGQGERERPRPSAGPRSGGSAASVQFVAVRRHR